MTGLEKKAASLTEDEVIDLIFITEKPHRFKAKDKDYLLRYMHENKCSEAEARKNLKAYKESFLPLEDFDPDRDYSKPALNPFQPQN